MAAGGNAARRLDAQRIEEGINIASALILSYMRGLFSALIELTDERLERLAAVGGLPVHGVGRRVWWALGGQQAPIFLVFLGSELEPDPAPAGIAVTVSAFRRSLLGRDRPGSGAPRLGFGRGWSDRRDIDEMPATSAPPTVFPRRRHPKWYATTPHNRLSRLSQFVVVLSQFGWVDWPTR